MLQREIYLGHSYKSARELLGVRRDDHAVRLGLDPQVVRRALDWLAGFVRPAPPFPVQWALDLLISHYQAPKLRELFKNIDFRGLPHRAAFVDFLRNRQTPLYSLEELAELTEAFRSHLLHDRELLLRTGLPRISFEHCLFLHLRLTWLYYVKVPSAISFGRNASGGHEASYQWAPLVPKTVIIPDVLSSQQSVGDLEGFHQAAGEDEYEEVADSGKSLSYEDTPLIEGLSADDAARLEAGRAKLFHLKISILEQLVHALRSGTAANLWDHCLPLLTEALTADDVGFYLRIDDFYSNLIPRIGRMVGGGDKLVVGGLTDLLDVIGHYEKEIVVGAMAQTREALTDLVKLDSRRSPRLIVENYFQLMGLPERQLVDTAFELFQSLESQEKAFWKRYRRRINHALENDFEVEIVPRQKVKRKLPHKFKPEAEGLARPLKARSEAAQQASQRKAFPLGELLTGEDYLFRKAGQSWIIKYEGEMTLPKDAKGLRYIHCLLSYPNTPFHVLLLVQIVEKPELHPATDVFSKMSREQLAKLHLRSPTPEEAKKIADPILDEQAVKAYKRTCTELKSKLKEALKKGRTKQAEHYREQIEFIETQLRAARGLRRRTRKSVDEGEKARQAVCQDINRSLKAIKEDAPNLSCHLDEALKPLGFYPCYRTDRLIPWVT